MNMYMYMYLSTSFRCPSMRFFCRWADFGFFLGPLGQPLDHFGTPWDALEVALIRLGAFTSFFSQNWMPIPCKWLSSTQPAHKK